MISLVPIFLASVLTKLSLSPLLAVVSLWYALPLIVSVSLVCAATRHEEILPILNHALRFGIWVIVFMAGVMVLLSIMGWLA